MERGKRGRVRANVLGHVPFTNQSNESFLLCVWDQLYLQPLQRVTEVIKCLQQEHMMSHAMNIHIPPGRTHDVSHHGPTYPPRQNTRCLTPQTYISPQAEHSYN